MLNQLNAAPPVTPAQIRRLITALLVEDLEEFLAVGTGQVDLLTYRQHRLERHQEQSSHLSQLWTETGAAR